MRSRPRLLPGKELLEQRFLRCFRRTAVDPRVCLGQESVESCLGRAAGRARRGLPHQPVLRRLETGPAGNFRGQVHFAPLGMAWRLLELVELTEKGVHEAGSLVVSLAMR